MKNYQKKFFVFVITIIVFFTLFGCSQNKITIHLTQEQNDWIKAHPTVVVAPDPEYAPFEFFDENGNFSGLASEYIKFFEENTDLNFEIAKLGNWEEIIKKTKNKDVDLLSALAYTPQRDEYLEFTDSYFNASGVIITRNDSSELEGLEGLSGKVVSVVKDYVMYDYITVNYPDINIDAVSSVDEGLRNVSFGYSQAFVENIATATYYLEESVLTNLKVANKFDYKLEIRMGVRDDWPELSGIINDIFKQIPNSTKKEFENNWFYSNESNESNKENLKQIAIIGMILVAILGLVIIWNITLKNKVNKQTEILKSELLLNHKYQEELKVFNEKLEDKVERRTYLLNETNKELEKSMFNLQVKNEEIEDINHTLEQTLEDMKAMQEQLIQSEKMAALGNLVAGIAHEINTPLGIAVTAVSNIDKIAEVTLNELQNQALSKAKLEKYFRNTIEACDITMKNLENAADLIRRFKQVAVDQQTRELREFNLNSYVQDIIISLKPEYKNKSIKFETNCEDIFIVSYPGAVSQILTNFIVNSIRHGFENGNDYKIFIDVYKENGNIIIKYADNGKGVDDENLNKIFDPFYTTKRNKGGTGIGLNIVYNLVVDLLKGQISVENKINNLGLIFKIKFPIDEKLKMIDLIKE